MAVGSRKTHVMCDNASYGVKAAARIITSQNNDKTRQGQVIDENLKRVYQDMLEEKVPDRFLDLLTQLKEQESASKKGGNAK